MVVKVDFSSSASAGTIDRSNDKSGGTNGVRNGNNEKEGFSGEFREFKFAGLIRYGLPLTRLHLHQPERKMCHSKKKRSFTTPVSRSPAAWADYFANGVTASTVLGGTLLVAFVRLGFSLLEALACGLVPTLLVLLAQCIISLWRHL